MAYTLGALRARLKTWSASASIGDVTYTIVNALPSRSMGIDRVRSTCSFVTRMYPDCAAGDYATVTLMVAEVGAGELDGTCLAKVTFVEA